jgi:hypothetical protein
MPLHPAIGFSKGPVTPSSRPLGGVHGVVISGPCVQVGDGRDG